MLQKILLHCVTTGILFCCNFCLCPELRSIESKSTQSYPSFFRMGAVVIIAESDSAILNPANFRGKGGNGHAKTSNILIQQPHSPCHRSAIIRQDCMSFTVQFSTVIIIIHLRPSGLWTLGRTFESHVGYHCCQKLSSFQCQIQRKQFINSEKFDTSCLCFQRWFKKEIN